MQLRAPHHSTPSTLDHNIVRVSRHCGKTSAHINGRHKLGSMPTLAWGHQVNFGRHQPPRSGFLRCGMQKKTRFGRELDGFHWVLGATKGSQGLTIGHDITNIRILTEQKLPNLRPNTTKRGHCIRSTALSTITLSTITVEDNMKTVLYHMFEVSIAVGMDIFHRTKAMFAVSVRILGVAEREEQKLCTVPAQCAQHPLSNTAQALHLL